MIEKPFIRIPWCHGHPMYWSTDQDRLACVYKTCLGHVKNPDHPFVPPRTFLPGTPPPAWASGFFS